MSFTLDNQMRELFDHGLQLLREHHQQIEQNWQQIQQYLQKASRKTALTMDKSIHILANHLFEENDDQDILLDKIKVDWDKEIGSLPANQFVITLLENAVHRATKTKNMHHGKDMQAIQYVFTKISEHVLSEKVEDLFAMNTFLHHMVVSRQLPINWIAIVTRENDIYSVKKWFNERKSLLPQNSILAADTMYSLTEKLLAHEEEPEKQSVFSIPVDDTILMFSTEKSNTNYLVPFMNHALQLLQTGKATLHVTRKGQQWKDSVILFQDSLIRARTFHEALKLVTDGFIHYLPFKRSAIFSYSSDEIGVGLSGSRFDSKEIQAITEDVRNLPALNKGLDLLRLFGKGMRFFQPLYIPNARENFPAEYIEKFQLRSVVVAPIFKSSNNELLGAAFLDQGPNSQFTISEDTYTALIKFGQTSGEILGKFTNSIATFGDSLHFSPREMEVLQLMAQGESTTSAANILHLSEYTVRDYITSIMQKMDAKNRTEAVARAIRKGII